MHRRYKTWGGRKLLFELHVIASAVEKRLVGALGNALGFAMVAVAAVA